MVYYSFICRFICRFEIVNIRFLNSSWALLLFYVVDTFSCVFAWGDGLWGESVVGCGYCLLSSVTVKTKDIYTCLTKMSNFIFGCQIFLLKQNTAFDIFGPFWLADQSVMKVIGSLPEWKLATFAAMQCAVCFRWPIVLDARANIW